MPAESVIIINQRGLHARASAKFVGTVAKLDPATKVLVSKDGPASAVSGSSIMGLMMLGAARGDTIRIEVEGGEADKALAQLVGLVKDGFGED